MCAKAWAYEMFGRKNYVSEGLLGKTLILLLAGIVLICTAAIMPAIWDAAKEFAKAEAAHDPRECLTIQDDSERLKCLEQRVERTAPPARGAFAPPNIFGVPDKTK
jgi:hypothetical protein